MMEIDKKMIVIPIENILSLYSLDGTTNRNINKY